MELYSPFTIKEIREKYGFRFSKSLGQNFITDRNVLNKIVEGAEIGPEDLVIEIGPGFGALTAELARVSSRVVAIEIDNRLIPILQDTLKEYDNVEVVNRDILKTDIGAIIDECRDTGKFTGRVRIAGNLPYYITTPIVMKILESESGSRQHYGYDAEKRLLTELRRCRGAKPTGYFCCRPVLLYGFQGRFRCKELLHSAASCGFGGAES